MNVENSPPDLPLAGRRVVEFTHMVMGPTCGMVLADLGAEVIKIEPLAGDNTRRLLGSGAGFFAMFNRNKKSIALDLQTPQGKEAALRLIATGSGFDAMVSARASSRRRRQSSRWDSSRTRKGSHPIAVAAEAVVVVVKTVDIGVLLEWARTRPTMAGRAMGSGPRPGRVSRTAVPDTGCVGARRVREGRGRAGSSLARATAGRSPGTHSARGPQR